MSNYTALEKQALKDFDVESFRGSISKNKLIKISSLLHEMNPEVAMKIIEQFPKYKDGLCEIASDSKEIITKELTECAESSKTFYEVKLREIDILENELSKEYLTTEERFLIFDKIAEITAAIDRKDSEIRNFALGVIRTIGSMAVAISFGLLAGLGSSIIKKGSTTDEDDDA